MNKRNTPMPPPPWPAVGGGRFVGRPWGAPARGASNPVQQAIPGASQVSTGMSLNAPERQRMPYGWAAAGGRPTPGSDPSNQGVPAPSMHPLRESFKHSFHASQPPWPLHSQQEAEHQTSTLDGFGGSQYAEFPPPASQPSQTAARLLEELNRKPGCPAHQPSCPTPAVLTPTSEATDTLAEMTAKLDTMAQNNADMLLIIQEVASKLEARESKNAQSAQLTALAAAVQDALQHIAHRPSLREAATQTTPTTVPLASASASHHQESKPHLLSNGSMPKRRPRAEASISHETQQSPAVVPPEGAMQTRSKAAHGVLLSPGKLQPGSHLPLKEKEKIPKGKQPVECFIGLDNTMPAVNGQISSGAKLSSGVKRPRQDSIICLVNADATESDDATSSEDDEEDDYTSRRLARRVYHHRNTRLRLQTTKGPSKAEP